jgi:hypothetical protein
MLVYEGMNENNTGQKITRNTAVKNLKSYNEKNFVVGGVSAEIRTQYHLNMSTSEFDYVDLLSHALLVSNLP